MNGSKLATQLQYYREGCGERRGGGGGGTVSGERFLCVLWQARVEHRHHQILHVGQSQFLLKGDSGSELQSLKLQKYDVLRGRHQWDKKVCVQNSSIFFFKLSHRITAMSLVHQKALRLYTLYREGWITHVHQRAELPLDPVGDLREGHSSLAQFGPGHQIQLGSILKPIPTVRTNTRCIPPLSDSLLLLYIRMSCFNN